MIVGGSYFRGIAQPFILPPPRHPHLILTPASHLRSPTKAHSTFNACHPVVCKDEGKKSKDSNATAKTATKKRSKASKSASVKRKESVENGVDGVQPLLQPVSVKIPVGDRHVTTLFSLFYYGHSPLLIA